MTCVIGIARDGKIVMGADSAGVGTLDLRIRKDPKVFKNGDFLIGFTTSFRMGQLLRFAFNPPKPKEGQDDYAYLCTEFIDAVRACLATGGFKTVDKNVETGGIFLVGYRGHIYRIDNDFQVGIPATDFEAVGCGESYAIGAVAALIDSNKPIQDIVATALEIAEHNSAGVRGPFTIIESN